MDPAQIQGMQALATLVSGPLAGWVVAYMMGQKIDTKDKQLIDKHDAHIATLEEQGKRCDENFKALMQHIFHLEDKKADKQ